MTVEEILKKKNYRSLINALETDRDSLSPDTLNKTLAIRDLLSGDDTMIYQNNALQVLKLYLVDGLTIEQISSCLYFSTRHVDRLKRNGVELVKLILERIPPATSFCKS